MNQVSEQAQAERKSGRRFGLAAICCAVMFLFAVYFGAFGVLLPVIGRTFGLGPAAEARLFPTDFGGFVVGVLLCGTLSDRLGRKTVLLSGIAAYALGLFLFGEAASFALALLASALIGGGSGAMEAVASALVSDLYPERRAFVLNAIQVAFGLGASLSPAFSNRLLATGTDWRLLYMGLAAANVVLFLLLSMQRVPRTPRGGESLDFAALRAALKHPAFGLLCLAQALYVGAETGFFSWMPSYFEARLPGGKAAAGIVVTVFWVAITIGRTSAGALTERMPLLRLTLLLAASSAVFSALALMWSTPQIVMAFVALTGLAFSAIYGFILAEAGERFPTVAGTVFGGIVASGGAGGAIIPWMIGATASTSMGWRGALGIVPLTALGMAAILLLILRREPRPANGS